MGFIVCNGANNLGLLNASYPISISLNTLVRFLLFLSSFD